MKYNSREISAEVGKWFHESFSIALNKSEKKVASPFVSSNLVMLKFLKTGYLVTYSEANK